VSLLILETKTSSEDITPGSTYWRRIRMDPQIGVYLRAAQQMGLDTIGIGYDVLGKPALRPLRATPPESRKYTKPTKAEPTPRLYANQRDRDETPEEYGDRCLKAIVAEPDAYYQRALPVRLHQEQHDGAVDVWQTAQAMRNARRLNVYPRNPDACFQWSRACDFLAACCGDVPIDDPLLFRKEEKEHEELEDVFETDRAVLTQSSMRTFRACQRRYQIRYVLRMRPVVKPDALRTGSSVHRGVEALRRGASFEDACARLDQEDPYDYQRERAMLAGYVARWGDPTRGVVAVEQQFEVDLVNPETGMPSRTFLLAGKMDALYEGNPLDFVNAAPGAATAPIQITTEA
jgi:PD-(D/E)XK nuclease superfamily